MRKTFWMLVLISTVLVNSGCALFNKKTDVVVVGGVHDYVLIPKGTVIKDVPLPIEGGKADYVAQSNMQLVTLSAWRRIESQCGGSSPRAEDA